MYGIGMMLCMLYLQASVLPRLALTLKRDLDSGTQVTCLFDVRYSTALLAHKRLRPANNTDSSRSKRVQGLQRQGPQLPASKRCTYTWKALSYLEIVRGRAQNKLSHC